MKDDSLPRAANGHFPGEEIAAVVARALEDQFAGEFVFNPIFAIPKIDDYGEDVFPYIHIYIVYEGDQANLDPRWMAGLAGRIRPLLAEIGVHDFPVTSFRSKSDWLLSEKTMRQELARELERAVG